MRLSTTLRFMVSASCIFSAHAAMADPIELKFASGAPSRATVNQIFSQWADKVSKDSNGALRVKLISGGVLGKDGEIADRVRNGVADIGWDLPFYYPGRYPKFDVVTLPLLAKNAEQASVGLWQLYEKGLLKDEFTDVMPIMFLGFAQTAVFTKKPLASMDDAKGIKLSAGGKVRSDITSAIGAIPVPLKTPEIYTGLQRSLVDGSLTVFNIVTPFKLNEVVDHAVTGPFGGGAGFVVMNKKSFDALPPAAQKAIRDNSGLAATRAAGQQSDAFEIKDVANFKALPDHSVREASSAEVEKLKPAFLAIQEAWAKQVVGGSAVLDAFRAEVTAATPSR